MKTAFDDLCDAAQAFEIYEVKKYLATLKLEELRALAMRYWGISTAEAKGWNKAELAHELAIENAEQIQHEIETKRKPKGETCS